MVDIILIEMHIVDEYVRGQLVLVQLQVVLVVVLPAHQSMSHVHAGDADVGRRRHAGGRQGSRRYDQVAAVDPMQAARDAGTAALQMPATGAETCCSNDKWD